MKQNSVWVAQWCLSLVAAAALAGCGGKANPTVTLSGSVSGLTTGTLTLGNGSSTTVVPTNGTSFTIPVQVPVGAAYLVYIAAQPSSLTCTVANAGAVASNAGITNVSVTCVPKHSVGGTITGLVGNGLQLVNGSEIVKPAAGSTTFAFTANLLASGQTYGVGVLQQPDVGTCQVQNGAGYMASENITSVNVICQ